MGATHIGVTISDWLIVLSTLLSPLIAVQVQKWIELGRESKNRKRRVFEMLMGTRRDVLSFDHKRALNMIDYVFVNDKPVINAWHNYFDSLSIIATDENSKEVLATRQRLFIEMLRQMSNLSGYKFEDRTLERGYYSPQAHVDLEQNQQKITAGLVRLVEGASLKMDVTSFPIDPTALAAQISLQEKLASTITDSGEMKVTIRPAPTSDQP